MSLGRPPNNSNEQFIGLLIEHCYEIYESKMKEEFPSVNGSDQFYQLHTDALFSALIPFSENSNANSVDAKYLSFLTEKLKCGYDKWKSSFDKKVTNQEVQSHKDLDDSLEKYNSEMTKRCSGISADELMKAHQHASKVATTHLENMNMSNTAQMQQAQRLLEKCIEIQERFYKQKNKIEIGFDEEWFNKLSDALQTYDLEFNQKFVIGMSSNKLEATHRDALKKAKIQLEGIKTKSRARFNYATNLLEKSVDTMKVYYEKQCNNQEAVIGSSIPTDEIFIQLGDEGFIGRGGYGDVYFGWMKSRSVVAIKLQKFAGSKENIKEKMKDFIKEVKLLNEANHPNVVRIAGYNSSRSSMAIVMEYLPGGNLHDILFSKDGDSLKYNISANLKLRFCADISSGITYLHNGFNDKRMVHGDLKPANILLTSDLRCKVADFGGADFATCTEEASTRVDAVGKGGRTRGFIAPERVQDPHAKLSKPMDVYSYGVIVYCILSHHGPHREYANFKEDLNNFNKRYHPSTVNIIKLHMKKCCEENPLNRPEIIDVRDELLQQLRLINLPAITKEVAELLGRMSIKFPYTQKKDCRVLSEFSDRF